MAALFTQINCPANPCARLLLNNVIARVLIKYATLTYSNIITRNTHAFKSRLQTQFHDDTPTYLHLLLLFN